MTLARRTVTPSVSIVELTQELVPPAAALLAQHVWPQHTPAAHQGTCEDILRRLLQWPSAQFFLAVQAEVLLGFASVSWGFSTRKGQPILRIQDLFTHPQYRRRGIAQALLQHLIRLGRQQGAHRLQLETGTQNTPARTLYTAVGFEWFPDKEIYMLFL